MKFFRKIIVKQEHIENLFRSEEITNILERLGIHDDNKKNFLNGLIGNGGNPFPASLIGNDHFIFRTVLDRLRGSQDTPITDEQKDQILQLIQSGELFRDVGYTITTVFKFVINPSNFEVPHIENLVENIPPAIFADIDTLFREIKNVSKGEANPNPQLLNHTLNSIYQTPQIGNTVEAANLLFDTNNQSLRLALILYARLNNVNIDEADIDEVRMTLLNKDSPDLGRLLVYVNQNKEKIKID